MSIRFIYGRAGSGKSEFIFNEITQKINNNNKIYIITPEQFSYQMERKLLETLEGKSVINAEVISFKRIAERVALEIGGVTTTVLSKTGQAMIIYNILESQKNKLNFLGNSNSNVDLVLNTIKEFKKHNINYKKLKKTKDNVEDIYLKTKLSDISNVYEAYENTIINNYIDEDDRLTILAKQLEESRMFDSSYIYIDEFFGFTGQEYEIIRKLLKKAKQVTVTLCTDSILNMENKETDIFYSNKKTAKKLIEIANSEGIKIDEEVKLDNSYRFKNEELKFLENNLSKLIYKQYNQEVKNINLFLSENPYNQMKQIAQEIIKLVRDENYDYRDISIITTDVENISNITKTIFEKYQIPVFIDKKDDLSGNILIKYILALLDIFANSWSHEAMFTYIKSGFLDLKKEEIYAIENYCIKYGIKGSKWYEKDWKNYDETATNLNDVRIKIVTPLLELKRKLNESNNIKEMTECLYNFLNENNIQEKLASKIQKLKNANQLRSADEYKRSWEILSNIFDELVLVLKNEKVNLKKYIKLLRVGLSYNDLGNIPQVIDQVILGDIERSRSHNVKVCFIINLNDGLFSNVSTSEGFLNDNDREILKENDSEIAKGTLEILYDNQFNIYKAFTIAEEKLYLYYLSTDNEGKALRPFMLVNKLKKMFPKLKEKSNIITNKPEITTQNAMFNEMLENIRKMQDSEEVDSLWFEIYNWYENQAKWNERLHKALRRIKIYK